MIKLALRYRRLGLKLVLLALLALPELAGAQFTYDNYGDVLAGFRKTGVNAANYEMVANLGSVTNLVGLSPGTVITITNFSASQLTDAFTNYNNLQWSTFAGVPANGRNPPPWVTSIGSFPANTLWYTLPRTNVNVQTTPPSGGTTSAQANTRSEINSVGAGAISIAGFLATSNADDNLVLVREPVTYSSYILSAFIGGSSTTNGDFGDTLPTSVENWTPANFTSGQEVSDFYQICPQTFTDPITGTTNGTAYFVGYFTLNSSGTMTFTRASLVSTPSAGTVTASVTNGFGPLTVVFTNNSSSGSITNWVWNFGNGTIITNTTSGNVTNTYSATGSYTVTLTVYGPGGTNSYTVANYIVTSAKPKLGSLTVSSGKLIFGGSNCPSGVKYRILASTNAATLLANWTPVYTNTFASNGSFSFTNTISSTNSYFIMVSP